jgi:hypothetical protein
MYQTKAKSTEAFFRKSESTSSRALRYSTHASSQMATVQRYDKTLSKNTESALPQSPALSLYIYIYTVDGKHIPPQGFWP